MGQIMYMRKGDAHTAPVAPVKGIPVGDLAVGNSVYINVNGTPKEFLIVHRGLPSSIYDSSCNGTWVLMKDIYEKRAWSSGSNSYSSSTIHNYLNSTFFNLLDANIQSIVKQVKLPYRRGSGTNATNVSSGSDGLEAKIFLLSGVELNWSTSTSGFFPKDGATLSYFSGCGTTDSKRIAYFNGSATTWWLRSPYCGYNDGATVFCAAYSGAWDHQGYSQSTIGMRPALILPNDVLIDEDTKVLKGAA